MEFISEVSNENCMDMMARYPDKYFHLAIVDPPYGIRQDGHRENNRSKLARSKKYHPVVWDQSPPDEHYFKELFRVSKNQIIWGANHFIDKMPYPSSCWMVWDKNNGNNDFADCELAWASFPTAVRIFKFRWAGMLQGNMMEKEIRIHPTQKPVQLYKWLMGKYAQPGDRILDTHLGSGSSRIAAYQMGFDFYGCEIDPKHFNDQQKRFKEQTAQIKIF